MCSWDCPDAGFQIMLDSADSDPLFALIERPYRLTPNEQLRALEVVGRQNGWSFHSLCRINTILVHENSYHILMPIASYEYDVTFHPKPGDNLMDPYPKLRYSTIENISIKEISDWPDHLKNEITRDMNGQYDPEYQILRGMELKGLHSF